MRGQSVGVGLTRAPPKGGGQQAALARLKAAISAAAISNPDDNAVYSTTTPVISMSGSATAGLSNQYLYTAHADKIGFIGGEPVKSDGSVFDANYWMLKGASPSPQGGQFYNLGYGANQWYMWASAVEFETDAPDFEVNLALANNGEASGSRIPVRCIVDGQYLDKVGTSLFSVNMFYKVTGLPAGTFKRIRVESRQGLKAVRVAPGYSIRAVQSPAPKVVVDGDSFTEGQSTRYGGVILGYGHDAWSGRAMRKLGLTRWRDVAVGLTGYGSTGGGTRRNLVQRLGDWTGYEQVDAAFVAAGYNDGTAYTTTAALATDYWRGLRAAQPNALIVVLGVWPGPSLASHAPMEVAIKAAFDAWGDRFSIFIPISTAASPLVAEVDSNGSHYSNAGHLTAADFVVPVIRSAILAL